MIATAEILDPTVCPASGDPIDVHRIRQDFPILESKVYGKPLIYLDNAATTQKPRIVIDALNRFYTEDCSNIHRGVHALSQRSTDNYEHARRKVQGFINAPGFREVVFVRGTTEGINLVAQSYGRSRVGPGDEIVISALEHHSNIVPWQMLCEEKRARLMVAPIDDRGQLLLEDFGRLLNPRVKLVAVTHVSNALGTVNPIQKIVDMAHARGIPVLVDGAQAVAHLKVDVGQLGCDFYTFSGHKLFGPTGIGVLYGKSSLLEAIPPYQGGGDMIRSVGFEETTYNSIPHKFEAGTPDIAGAIGLGAAVDYLGQIGLENTVHYERRLLAYATAAISAIPGVRIIGTAAEKVSVLSFAIEGVSPHDAGIALDQEGIAVRTGYHCAQPLMKRLGVSGTIRASVAFYNTEEEIDALAEAVMNVKEVLG